MSKGFSLIELILVVAILIVIATASLSYVGTSYGNQNLLAAKLEVEAVLNEAQGAAAQGYLDSSHGVYFNKSNRTFTLYAGENYASRDQTKDFLQYWPQSVSITDPAASSFEVTFTETTGTTTPVTITFTADDGTVDSLSINSLGVIE